jgi:hypothetical protein
VRRATSVVVRGVTPEGEIRVVEADGFEARAFQHELDHLDGLLILDRVASVRTDVFRRKRYAAKGEHLSEPPPPPRERGPRAPRAPAPWGIQHW